MWKECKVELPSFDFIHIPQLLFYSPLRFIEQNPRCQGKVRKFTQENISLSFLSYFSMTVSMDKHNYRQHYKWSVLHFIRLSVAYVTNLFIYYLSHLCIWLADYYLPAICLSLHLAIYTSIHLYIYPSIGQPIHPIYPSIYTFINLFICLSIYYVSTHPSIDLSM